MEANFETEEVFDESENQDFFAASFRSPLGSFCAQVILTEILVLTAQRICTGQDRFFEEFLCTFQTAILSQELNIIQKVYGKLVYSVGLFCLGVLYSVTFHKNVHANPVSTIHLFSTHGRMSQIAELAVHVSVQTLAAVFAEKYVHFLWSSKFFNSNLAVIHMENPCKSDLQVPIFVGIFVEGLATFIHRLMHHTARDSLDEIMLCSLGGVICNLAATPFTGGYSNPSLAFITHFACREQKHWEFLIVYVAGPIIAAYLVGQYGDRIWQRLHPSRHRSIGREIVQHDHGHHSGSHHHSEPRPDAHPSSYSHFHSFH